jgi:cytochrome b561
MTTDKAPRYDHATIVLHWLTAGIVLLQWASASLIFLEQDHGLRMIYWDVHFALGLTLFAVIAARLWWRRRGGRQLPPLGSGWAEAAARAVHGLLYLLMLWLVGLGIVIIALRGWPLAGLFTVAPVAPGYHALSSTLITVHKWSADVLMAVAFGHALVALFHHLILKDGALLRMAGAR